MTHDITLTGQQHAELLQHAGRLPLRAIAGLIGVEPRALRRALRHDAALREAYERAKARRVRSLVDLLDRLAQQGQYPAVVALLNLAIHGTLRHRRAVRESRRKQDIPPALAHWPHAIISASDAQ